MIKKIITSMLLILFFTAAYPMPGDRLMSIQLRDVNGNMCWFPDNTTVPVVVFYEEYSSMESNRTFMNMILPLAKQKQIRICRVINMAPAWYLPDSFIYHDMKKTVSDSKQVEYYFDDNELLMVKWRLKDNDSGAAVLIINSAGILVQEIYGIMEWNQAVSYAEFLGTVR